MLLLIIEREHQAQQLYRLSTVASTHELFSSAHVDQPSRGDAGNRVQAMLEWDVEVLEKVFVQVQQSDDLKAVDSKISAHLNRVVCVSECANMKAYLEVVDITV
jgi:hypothetical protein